ncbi:MAG TPA: hypothetical protein VJM82_00650 [Nitrospiraceae bacterium]|nr:hypothetical protein [Nitrospiraceae bacterium]
MEDRTLAAVIGAVIAAVFVLDLMTPLGIAIWVLYVVPLGLTRWASRSHLPIIIAGICTVLVILGYFYSPTGASPEFAIANRSLGVMNLWGLAVFLLYERA